MLEPLKKEKVEKKIISRLPSVAEPDIIHGIRFYANGEPDVLQWEEFEIVPPPPGYARVRHTAVTVNFSDVNIRRGGFYIRDEPSFPITPGNEAAGVVEAVGDVVTEVQPGDRVVYVGSGSNFFNNTGAYAEERNLVESCLIKIPDDISDETAAAMMLKGLTASTIINGVYKPSEKDIVLIHAAASGMGLVLTQWVKHLGATVIGTVGSEEKARIAQEHGCDHTILYREVDFVEAVKKIVPEGVTSVFDGVGNDTLIKSFDCVRPFTTLVNYGNASGNVPPLNVVLLAKKGSLSVSRPGVGTIAMHKELRDPACEELFELVRQGIIKIEVGATYPLREAEQAHRDLEARKITGSMLLIP